VPADDTSIRRALYGKMAGDTTLNNLLATPPQGSSKSIYYAVAPQGASFPYVLFDKSSGVPTYTMQTGTSAMENTIWLIKAVDQSLAHRCNAFDLGRNPDVSPPRVGCGLPRGHGWRELSPCRIALASDSPVVT
jgi:hypothetical protein